MCASEVPLHVAKNGTDVAVGEIRKTHHNRGPTSKRNSGSSNGRKNNWTKERYGLEGIIGTEIFRITRSHFKNA